MLIVFKGIKQEYVYVADTEYDNMQLIQCAGLVFKRVDERNDIYQLAFSFNEYVKKAKVNKYVERYTGISAKFLKEHGKTIQEFRELYEEMFEGIDPIDVLYVAHGAQADKKVMKNAGVSFTPGHSYCTYKNAKRILKREAQLTLGDVAAEAGFKLTNEHDAYADATATAIALSFLKKIEWQES